MPISIQPLVLSLLLATALFQVTPNFQPTTSFTYLPGVNSPSSLVSVPSVQSYATPSPTSNLQTTPSPTTAPPAAPPTTNTPASSPPITTTDSITPNPNTLSNILKSDILTTNPTASPYQNTGYYDYTSANTAFTAASQFATRCNGQNIISYVAFKQYSTQFYLTPNLYFLTLLQNSSPNQQQLFTAIQNIDCTWSFKTNDGLYLSLNTAFSYLTLSASLSLGERFYLERKQDWIYVESANSYRYFWTVTNGIVLVNMNSASRFIMEVWPNLNAGWN